MAGGRVRAGRTSSWPGWWRCSGRGRSDGTCGRSALRRSVNELFPSLPNPTFVAADRHGLRLGIATDGWPLGSTLVMVPRRGAAPSPSESAKCSTKALALRPPWGPGREGTPRSAGRARRPVLPASTTLPQRTLPAQTFRFRSGLPGMPPAGLEPATRCLEGASTCCGLLPPVAQSARRAMGSPQLLRSAAVCRFHSASTSVGRGGSDTLVQLGDCTGWP
jgi:hypothetical protein